MAGRIGSGRGPSAMAGRAAAGRGGGGRTDAASLFARSRASKAAAAGRGRGAAAAAMGKSLATPIQRFGRNAPGAGRSLVGGRRGMAAGAGRLGAAAGRGPGRGMGVSSAAGAGAAGRGGALRNKTKMKMMDVSEVESLTKEHKQREGKIAEEESREARKRRIMEAAAAKGLRTKGKKVKPPKDAASDAQDNPSEEGKDGPGDKVPTKREEDTIPNAADSAGVAEPLRQDGMASLLSAADTASNAVASIDLTPQFPPAAVQAQNHPAAVHAPDLPAAVHTPTLPAAPAPAPVNFSIPGFGGDDAGLIAMALSTYQQQEHVVPVVDPMAALQQQAQSVPAVPAPTETMAHPAGGPFDAPGQPQIAHAAPFAPPADAAVRQNWQQLLDKSNKLSAEDRFRIEQFFTDRFNPTPNIMLYKIKLNEEKTIDHETGQTVKETLYLELDYNTFGFKKLRKVKKK